MASYSYPAGPRTFGARDQLAPGSPDKVVTGGQLDLEYEGIASGKLDKSGTDFDGTIQNGTIEGGTY